MRGVSLLLSPFWWQESPGVLRRGDARLRVGPRRQAWLRRWSSPRTVEEVAALEGAGAGAVARAAQHLLARGVLTPAASAELRPTMIELEITSRCNASCIMCPRSTLRRHRGFAHMDGELFRAVLRNVAGRGVPTYYLCGIGEPLLHPRVFEFAALLRQAEPSARLVCVTNGFCLEPPLVEGLLASPLDCLEISLHSVDEEGHRRILRSFPVRTALERIDHLLERRRLSGSRLEVRVGQVLVAPSPEPDPELARWAEARGLPFAAWRSWNRAGHVPESVLADHPSEPRGFAGSNRSPETCSEYANTLFIDYLGNVLSCCCDFANETAGLNAGAATLEQILAVRLRALASGKPLSPICDRCDAPMTNKDFLPTDYFRVAAARA